MYSRAQFFGIKPEENETLDEYWKRLVVLERKFEFNRILPEEIITYKFAATMNNKKARDKLIKGPLKLQLALETTELHFYNRKNGDKKSKYKNREKGRVLRNSADFKSEKLLSVLRPRKNFPPSNKLQSSVNFSGFFGKTGSCQMSC